MKIQRRQKSTEWESNEHLTEPQHVSRDNPAQAEKAQTFEKMFTTPQSPAKGERKAQG